MGFDWKAFDKLDRKEQMEKFQDILLSKGFRNFILENIDEIHKRFMFVNKYLLLDHLPEGFYKRGYFAIDQFTQQPVALLLTKKGVIQNRPVESDVNEDLIHLRESLFSYRLHHPNMIQFYESGMTNDEQTYIAYKYEEGKTLEELIYLPFKDKQIIRILYQISKALEYLHNNGLVHGDVKASNAILTEKGIVKLGDFGTIRTIEENIKLTGSLSYTAPEVLKGEPPTPAADVWGLGILGYVLTFGELPFSVPQEQWPNGLVDKILTTQPESLDCTKYLKRFLEKDPTKRLQNGRECRKALWYRKYFQFIFDIVE
jgi:serine/threonine protein kinase